MISVNGILGDFTLHTEMGKILITEEFTDESILISCTGRDNPYVTVIDHETQKGLCGLLRFIGRGIGVGHKHVTYELVYVL